MNKHGSFSDKILGVTEPRWVQEIIKRMELNQCMLGSQSKQCLSKELPTSTLTKCALGYLLRRLALLGPRQRLMWQTGLMSFLTKREILGLWLSPYLLWGQDWHYFLQRQICAPMWVCCILKPKEAHCFFNSHIFYFPLYSSSALVCLGPYGLITPVMFSQQLTQGFVPNHGYFDADVTKVNPMSPTLV